MVPGPQPSASDNKLKNLRLANWILACSVAIALISILFGLRANRRLGLEKKQLQVQLQSVSDTQPCDSPRLGDIVPPIEAYTSEGKRVTIHYSGVSRYLLFFVSFKCNECVKQLPNWNEISRTVTAKNVMF